MIYYESGMSNSGVQGRYLNVYEVDRALAQDAEPAGIPEKAGEVGTIFRRDGRIVEEST